MNDRPTIPNSRFARLTLGGAPAAVVSDGVLELGPPRREFLGLAEDDIAARATRHGLPADRTPLEQNALVVRLGGLAVLVDTGTGPRRPFGPTTGQLPASLAAAGFAPEDIDAVVVTHIHADHAWGLVDAEGRPAFPNAQVFVAAADHGHQTNEANGASEGARRMMRTHREVMAAVSDRLRLFEDGETLVEGVTTIAAPGHTIGHSVVRVEAAGGVAYALGDLFHLAAQLEAPEIFYRYDYDAAQSVASRRRLLARLADEAALIVGYHLPWPGVGRVVRDGPGYRFVAAEAD